MTQHAKEKIDSGRQFSRVTAVVTVSDRGSKGEREDSSGKALVERLSGAGFDVRFQRIVPDEAPEISGVLRVLADEERVALIVTTGGTGVSVRDVTPEATLAVVDRTVPGMAEAMRAGSLLKTPHAMISRAVAGIRGTSLIVNLPGSPKGAMEKPRGYPARPCPTRSIKSREIHRNAPPGERSWNMCPARIGVSCRRVTSLQRTAKMRLGGCIPAMSARALFHGDGRAALCVVSSERTRRRE